MGAAQGKTLSNFNWVGKWGCQKSWDIRIGLRENWSLKGRIWGRESRQLKWNELNWTEAEKCRTLGVRIEWHWGKGGYSKWEFGTTSACGLSRMPHKDLWTLDNKTTRSSIQMSKRIRSVTSGQYSNTISIPKYYQWLISEEKFIYTQACTL